MATYFHHHHHHHHNQQGSNNSDDGALQTLILMNPNFVGYSDAQQQQPPQSSSPSNFLFHAPTLYHAPPPLLPQLVGVPLHSPNSPYAPPQPSHAQHYAAWAQLGSMPPERESPRAQQGLSLTLSSHNNNHSYTVSGHGQPEQLQPSPGIDAGSESPAPSSAGDVHGAAALMTSSKYLKAAQELLEEVVNVSVDRAKPESLAKKSKGNKSESSPSAVAGEGPKEEHTAAELTASDKQELQMKKAKLITLLDEVDQRHRQYQHQMQAVVASFEQVAGANSARTYTSLALKTISSQFRCLRGAISGQIKAANKGLGEGEGEGGSRLKFLDHHMRQQRALQQLGMIQNNAWRPQRGLPEKAVSVLRAWLFEHFLHPYPKDSDKVMLAKQTGLTRSQVSNWFINARVRLWKPMIEEMYAEEVKEHEQNGSEGKSNKQEQHSEHGSRSVTDEKDHTYGDDQAKAAENHSSSIVIPGSTASLPPFKANVENPFALVGSSKMDGDSQGSLKKQRNNEMLSAFPDVELFNNGTKEEIQNKYVREKQEDCSMIPGSANSGFIGGLLSYPIGEMGRFGDGQFPASFSGNGVSLTLGLESLSMPGNNQAFLPNNQDIDQYRGRLEIGELSGFGGVKAPNASHSGNAYSAQLLHDFVA